MFELTTEMIKIVGQAIREHEEKTNSRKNKNNVRHKVGYAVKTGKLIKLPCEVCDDQTVEAHHPDYSYPLEVVWLCRTHHMELHKYLKENRATYAVSERSSS